MSLVCRNQRPLNANKLKPYPQGFEQPWPALSQARRICISVREPASSQMEIPLDTQKQKQPRVASRAERNSDYRPSSHHATPRHTKLTHLFQRFSPARLGSKELWHKNLKIEDYFHSVWPISRSGNKTLFKHIKVPTAHHFSSLLLFI